MLLYAALCIVSVLSYLYYIDLKILESEDKNDDLIDLKAITGLSNKQLCLFALYINLAILLFMTHVISFINFLFFDSFPFIWNFI